MDIIQHESGRVSGAGLFAMPASVYHADPAPEVSLSSSIAKVLISHSNGTTPHRCTNADKRRDVLALLNAENPGTASLSDREIARRAGVSPQTVGNIRRSLA